MKKIMGAMKVCGVKEMDIEIEKASSTSRIDDHLISHQIHISNGLLPALGAHSHHKVKLHCYVISPFNPYYRVWDTFLVLLVFYTAWVSPFEFGFLESPKGPLSITDNVVNGFFAVDILLTFFVAYVDKATYILVDNPKMIAWRYTKRGLVFDVISTIPSELARCALPHFLQPYGYFNMLRLWRLRRVSAMFSSNKLRLMRSEKLLDAEHDYVELKSECEEATRTFENIVLLMNEEIVRFQEQKTIDMGLAFHEFAKGQAHLANSIADAWRSLLPRLDECSSS